jgi:elongation factor Ts
MGTLVERNCETDFVSKNEEFQAFAAKIADVALSKEIKSIDALLAADFGTGTSVADTITSMIATIGENIKLRRVESLTADGGVVAGYSHMGGKIGTLVAIEGEGAASQKELASDIAMHIAAFNPKYLDSKTVDTADLEQEKAIAKKKLIEEGKPEDMIEKILVGQMNKYFKEVCLVNQAFVKDSTGKTSVEKHIEQTAKGCSIKSFVRFGLGEGIEKKQEDFAAEVQAALN